VTSSGWASVEADDPLLPLPLADPPTNTAASCAPTSVWAASPVVPASNTTAPAVPELSAVSDSR
jgi:hypothetical protein